MLMELCTFCQRIVIDDQGQKTDDFGVKKDGRLICARCMKAFEFSLGI
jgi:hypothetical protein